MTGHVIPYAQSRRFCIGNELLSQSRCPLCSGGSEDVTHVLLQCVGSRAIWDMSAVPESVKQVATSQTNSADTEQPPTKRKRSKIETTTCRPAEM